jgi:vacuolar-type H+-ATPase subunit F/Vma7
MNIIKQNPFRILGLTGNATEKELQRQLSKIKAYTRVGKEINLDYDLDFLGRLERNSEIIQDASNKIEQADKKIIYSLFWFVNNTKFDDIALSYLKDNHIEKAIEIWEKTLKDEITSKNCSSYQNISTLYIALSINDNYIDLDDLKKGLSLKEKILQSDGLTNFSQLITGNSINDPIKISKKFVDEIIELLKPYNIPTTDVIFLFNNFSTEIKKYVSAKFTEVPISNIENRIDKTVIKRKDNPRNANIYGEELYKSTKSDLLLLKNLLGNNNLQYQILADNIAKELMQCGIDYVNILDDPDEIEIENALKLLKYANSIVVSSHIKDRIKENIKAIEELKEKEILQAIALLQSVKDAYEINKAEIMKQVRIQELSLGYGQTINWVKVNELIDNSIDWYKVIDLIQKVIPQNKIHKIKNAGDQAKINEYKTLVNFILDKISLFQKSKVSYLKYWEPVRTKTNSTTSSTTTNYSHTSSNNSSSGGCYIATMAYGDYNHPQVIILREFRDNKLAKNFFGKYFIKIYYTTSPYLVKMLKNQKQVNKLIRKLLNSFINKIK